MDAGLGWAVGRTSGLEGGERSFTASLCLLPLSLRYGNGFVALFSHLPTPQAGLVKWGRGESVPAC